VRKKTFDQWLRSQEYQLKRYEHGTGDGITAADARKAVKIIRYLTQLIHGDLALVARRAAEQIINAK
jgi:hypothetical protein